MIYFFKRLLCIGLLIIQGYASATPSVSENTLQRTAQDKKEIESVLNFWFEYSHHSQPLYDRTLWWEKSETLDNLIRERFGVLREKAIGGERNDWLKTPKGTLAYIVLIDQFSRNMFRNSQKMYQYDNLALNAAKHAIKQGWDRSLSLTERVFIYLPFEHSENIDDQLESVRLFSQLVDDAPDENKAQARRYLSYANEHYKIIKQFNRFPHRNKILARISTPQELAFLENHKGF